VLAQPLFPSLAFALAAFGLWVVVWLVMLWDARHPVEKLEPLAWLALALVGLSLFYLMPPFWKRWWVGAYTVLNRNMAPTLTVFTNAAGQVKSDVMVVQKHAYWFSGPQRGQVVVFKSAGLEGLPEEGLYVGRVAGLPGEAVSIREGHLTINGQAVTTPAVFAKTRYTLPAEAEVLNDPQVSFEVPENHYFVLGDNPDESYDSRFWGPVPRSHLVGRVTRVAWPPAHAGLVQ
jgi:signal peptidase I